MKTTISGLIAAVMALSVFATAGFALSMNSAQLTANGFTTYQEFAAVAGYDSTESSWQTTAYILENVMNDGSITLTKNVVNPSAWVLMEGKEISAEGTTMIGKEVMWWTEDSRTVGGAMKYPTVTDIFVTYTTFGTSYNGVQGSQSTDTVAIQNVADSTVGANGEFSHSRFVYNVMSTDPIYYFEGVGFGAPALCDVFAPIPPIMPVCDSYCGGQCC